MHNENLLSNCRLLTYKDWLHVFEERVGGIDTVNRM